MNKRNFVRLASATLAVSAAVSLVPASAVYAGGNEHGKDCPGTGVYLVTADNAKGPQYTLNLAPDGTITTFYSNSGTVSSATGTASTPDQGIYHCNGNNFTYRTIGFDLASSTKPAVINRLQGKFTYDSTKKTIYGEYEFRQFPLYSNPFGGGGTVVVKRTFSGVKISAP